MPCDLPACRRNSREAADCGAVMNYKHLYGPVTSRRLGSSLGVDVLPLKTCTLDCIYCQLGRTAATTLERREYIAAESVLAEIDAYFSGTGPRPDYVTFSGSGEPTLHSSLGNMIRRIKQKHDIRVAVLTNSSLLTSSEVRQELLAADLVVPSLDAATQGTFERVNRPAAGLRTSEIIEGLSTFRNEFGGELRLEILLVEGLNDSQTELEALKAAAASIRPDSIDLNTVARPPAEKSVSAVDAVHLAEIAAFFGPEARVVAASGKKHSGVPGETAEKIVALLRRRPCSFAEVCSSLGISTGDAAAALAALSRKGLVAGVDGRDDFYHAR